MIGGFSIRVLYNDRTRCDRAKNPQWTTGPRLLRPGEDIEFRFFLPAGVAGETLTVFAQYLKRADPGDAFEADKDLSWLDALPAERINLSFSDNQAVLRYKPRECGVEPGLLTVERLPWQTSVVHIADLKRKFPPLRKDPLFHEFILVEDQHQQMRFDRECPNPIWWWDYRKQEEALTSAGSRISHIDAPKVNVIRSGWIQKGDRKTITLKMHTAATIDNYAIALWDVPAEGNRGAPVVETNAKDFVVARNVDGEVHLVLFFDLNPNRELTVTLCPPEPTKVDKPMAAHRGSECSCRISTTWQSSGRRDSPSATLHGEVVLSLECGDSSPLSE